jgi:hypothetical protein
MTQGRLGSGHGRCATSASGSGAIVDIVREGAGQERRCLWGALRARNADDGKVIADRSSTQ